jgi:uncharacterized protein (TIGR02001 family)
MRCSVVLSLFAGALTLSAARPAMAQDLSADLSLVSDYRYRGLSLSNQRPALQLDVSLEDKGGAHAGFWASSIREPGSALELELAASTGYGVELGEHLSLDLTGTFYVYPGDTGSNYGEITASLEYGHGPATLGVGASFVPRQGGTRDDFGRASRNSYYFATAEYALSQTPVTLTASLGYERGFFDEVEGGGKWDWSAGTSLDLAPARIGLSYCGSNGGSDAVVAALTLSL